MRQSNLYFLLKVAVLILIKNIFKVLKIVNNCVSLYFMFMDVTGDPHLEDKVSNCNCNGMEMIIIHYKICGHGDVSNCISKISIL